MALPLLSTPPASAYTNTMVVIGDSISLYYNDVPGDPKRAWWSRLGSKTGLTEKVYAEGGSGYDKKGKCVGTTFEERINKYRSAIAAAKVVVIEGGVNDYAICLAEPDPVTGAKTRPATAEETDANIRRTLYTLDLIATTDRKVYITAPWGWRDSIQGHKANVTASLISASADRGFQYVDTANGVLDTAATAPDGVHPNDAGSLAIYKKLYYTTDLQTRFP